LTRHHRTAQDRAVVDDDEDGDGYGYEEEGAEADWGHHIATRLTWRPDLVTGAVLIGGFFIYLTIVSLRTVPGLIGELGGVCGGPIPTVGGFSCHAPDWVFKLAVLGLISPVASLLVVVGSAILILGRPGGRLLMQAGLVGLAAVVLGSAFTIITSQQPGLDAGYLWTEFATAFAVLLLAAFVTFLRNK
jgi:hypothetical protein